jgi:hypothetical protein
MLRTGASQAEIPSVGALIVLDGEGKRIVVRYYRSSFTTPAEEMAFEKKLFDKTIRTNAKNEGALRSRPLARESEVRTCTLHASLTPRGAHVWQPRSSSLMAW